MNAFIVRARDALETAQLLLDAGRRAGAANRASYAVFYADQAALQAVVGLEPRKIKTHHGLRRMFELHIVKPGRIDQSLARSIDPLESLRIGADYGDGAPDREEVKAAADRVPAFVDACEQLVREHNP